jgi:nitrite reductase (NADH) small subunit
VEFVPVARVEDVPEGTVRAVRAGEQEIALAHCDGRLEGCMLTCPWHGWQYDVRTGQNEFDLAIQLRTYEVQVEDGEVRVRV